MWPRARTKQPSAAIANSTFIHLAPSHTSPAVGRLEEVSRDVSMSGRGCGPDGACDRGASCSRVATSSVCCWRLTRTSPSSPRQELATMSGKPQMLCCAALPAEQDRTAWAHAYPSAADPGRLRPRPDFWSALPPREGPPCWLHGSVHTCVYVRHP